MNKLKLTPTEKKILFEIKHKKQLSRANLVQNLGLSKAMLTITINEFINKNLVTEAREKPKKNKKGQPALRLTFNPSAYNFVGINVSSGGIASAVCDLDGNEIWLSPMEELETDIDKLKYQVKKKIENALMNTNAPCNHIGFFVPGFVSSDQEILEITPFQESIPIRRLVDHVKEEFPTYELSLSNDVDIFFQALGNDSYEKVIFFLSLGVGISGTLFNKTQIYWGGYNQASNIGALMPETGPRPSTFDLSKYMNIPHEDLTFKLLDALFEKKDDRLFKWIDDRGKKLSGPLSAVGQLFNPHQIVIGGNLTSSIIGALIDRVDLSYYDTEGRLPIIKPEICTSDILGEHSRAVAAAAIPIMKIFY